MNIQLTVLTQFNHTHLTEFLTTLNNLLRQPKSQHCLKEGGYYGVNNEICRIAK